MSFTMEMWSVQSDTLKPVPQVKLDNEGRLENWIEKDPSIMGLDILIIGRQVPTDFGGWIDLLGINEEGDLTIIELKRDRTPRDVVAQALDYASWVNDLSYERVTQIAEEYLKQPFDQVFTERFHVPLPSSINTTHNIVIVASRLDDASERIINYLSSVHNLNINCVFFQVFKDGDKEYIGRSWLMDPKMVSERGSSKKKPWTGYYYVNIKEGVKRSWEDCVRYGFVSAGGGEWYRRSIQSLKKGDKILVYMGKVGYLGYGIVEEEACMVKDFKLDNGEYLLEQELKSNLGHDKDDEEKCEWAVKVKWISTRDKNNGIKNSNLFTHPNIVCKLYDFDTYRYLKPFFNLD